MSRKSDSRGERRISATEAGRTFSRVLDDIEHGKSYLVHRHGRDICHMTPVLLESRPLKECLSILRSRPGVLLDGRFSKDLLEIITGERIEERPWA